MSSKYTADSIRTILADDTRVKTRFGWMTRGDYAAMRGVSRIYASQLADEKAAEETRHHNNVGFAHGHAKIGTALGDWMDGGKRDGKMRRTTRGKVSGWVYNGKDSNGKARYTRFKSKFVGRDRVEVCHYLAGKYAQQLADFANGDLRNSVAKVAASEGK